MKIQGILLRNGSNMVILDPKREKCLKCMTIAGNLKSLKKVLLPGLFVSKFIGHIIEICLIKFIKSNKLIYTKG